MAVALPDVSARHTARRLAIYNHKGGVAKTTLTVNVGAALAIAGKRVLLVDSDPQCNLTSYLVEDTVVDSLLDRSDSPDGRTVWTAVKPVVDATGDVLDVAPIETSTPGLYLLPGDIRLSDFENDLTQVWADCFQRKVRAFREISALSVLINHIAAQYAIDYVFYDSGPNVGPLNRIILLDCDYFIVPAACDLFSLRALKTLGFRLGEWIKDWRIIQTLAPDGLYLLPGMPRLLGYIPQRFRVYGGKPGLDFARYLPRIEAQLHADVATILARIDPALTPFQLNELKLGEVKDFGGLAAASQRQGVPLQSVERGNAGQKELARKAFAAIAQKIQDLTSRT